jgi:lysozyme
VIRLELSDDGAEFIARFEGFSSTKYVCPAGKPSIGYGHVIPPGETLERVTTQEALALLQADATREAEAVRRALTVSLKPHQADALISLAYNCGGRAIARSTLVARLNDGFLNDAAEEFLKWNKIGRVESRGLTRRRIAERTLFLTGDYGRT